MAGTALVGIGAAALTGGAVLNDVDFPRSPRQVYHSLAAPVCSSDFEVAVGLACWFAGLV